MNKIEYLYLCQLNINNQHKYVYIIPTDQFHRIFNKNISSVVHELSISESN